MNKNKLSSIIPFSILLFSACSNANPKEEQPKTGDNIINITEIPAPKTDSQKSIETSSETMSAEEDSNLYSVDSTDECFKIPVEDIQLNSKNYSDRLISQSKYELMYTSAEGYKCKIIRHGGCSDNGCVPAWQNFYLIVYNTPKGNWGSEKELTDWFKRECSNFKWIMDNEVNELLDAPHVIDQLENIDWLHCTNGDPETFGIRISNDSTELYYYWR